MVTIFLLYKKPTSLKLFCNFSRSKFFLSNEEFSSNCIMNLDKDVCLIVNSPGTISKHIYPG